MVEFREGILMKKSETNNWRKKDINTDRKKRNSMIQLAYSTFKLCYRLLNQNNVIWFSGDERFYCEGWRFKMALRPSTQMIRRPNLITFYFKTISVGSAYRNHISCNMIMTKRSFWTVLTMVYNTQNHWVCGLVHRPEFYVTWEHDVSETGSVSVFKWREGDTYSVASLEQWYSTVFPWHTPRCNFFSSLYTRICWCIIDVIHSV
jgi:hypothetical protein